MSESSSPGLSRRALLAGGLATGAAGLLAACSSSGGTAADTSSGSAAAGAGASSLIAFFSQQGGVVRTGIPQRLVFGIGTADGALAPGGPDTLDLTVRTAAGQAVGTPIVAPRHSKDLPRAYYPATIDLPAAGNYQVTTTLDGQPVNAVFRVDDPSAVPIPQAGDAMPQVETPTVADPRGVDPICTRDPQCPLHAMSLTTALQQQKPVALLISTPAFCQVAICGPVLEVLLGQQAEFGDRVQMIHAEVYRSGEQAAKDLGNATLAPAVEAFHLPFEPTLILARPDGTIAERLDNIFDTSELRDSLSRMVA